MSIKLEFLKKSGPRSYVVNHKISDSSEISYAHFHEEYEVLLLKKGNLETTINGITYQVDDNTMIVENSLDIHQNILKGNPPYERYVVMFSPEFAASLSSEKTNLLDCFLFHNYVDGAKIAKLAPEDFEELVSVCEKLERCSMIEDEEYGSELSQRYAFGEFLLCVNSKYRKVKCINPKDSPKNSKLVYGIIQYLQKNYNAGITLDGISEKLGFDKNYMCSVFKDGTGVTIMSYLLKYRIQKAKDRLINGNSVESTCEYVGFNSLAHFSRTFKHYVGLSPKQFQKFNK